MPGRIWIKLGREGNSERVLTSIRCTDEQWPSYIEDLKDLCLEQLREFERVGKTQMTVFADDQANESPMVADFTMEEAKEKYPSIGESQRPFLIIISASGNCFLCDKTSFHLQNLLCMYI